MPGIGRRARADGAQEQRGGAATACMTDRLRRWGLPAGLALVSIGCAAAVALVEVRDPASAAPSGVGAVGTPVLSVRRLPEVVTAPIADRRLRDDLQAWAEDVAPDACAVVVGPTGEVLLDVRGDRPVVPASTHKLLTATAALVELGHEARFRTTAVGSPPVDGTIDGDLTLVGGGDPLLATADYVARFERQPQTFTDLDLLVQRIAASGVRRITGSIVGDEGRYDTVRAVPGWPDRYLDQHVIGPLSALTVNDGFAGFPATPTGGGELVPADDPAQHAAAVLTVLLHAAGVDVAGPPRTGQAPPGAVELAAVESPPLSDVVAQLLRESDNSTAELLLKELGRTQLDPSTAGGRTATTTVLAEAGVDLDGVRVEDGSGLSLADRLTCRVLVDLLQRPVTGPVLRSGLPVAGEAGTLADRFLGTPLVGHLRAKTGSLNSVASLAGVVVDGDGMLSFAYVVNAAPGRGVVDEAAVVASQERLGRVLLGWPRLPDLERLGPLPAPEG